MSHLDLFRFLGGGGGGGGGEDSPGLRVRREGKEKTNAGDYDFLLFFFTLGFFSLFYNSLVTVKRRRGSRNMVHFHKN